VGGRDVLRGAELALEGAGGAELVALDSFARNRDRQALRNAERAVADRRALAYLGDFHSSQVFANAPLLGREGLLAIAPVATHWALRGPTLVLLSPHDGTGAQAIATWLEQRGVRELLVVHDHDEGYGRPVGRMCADAARERGLVVRARPVWDAGESPQQDLGAAGAALYVGVAGSGAVDLWHALHAAAPELWLLGSDGVALDWLARALAPAAAERSRFFVAQRAPLAFYGFEAMALALDAIAAGGGDRGATVRAARAGRQRDSVLGRYALDRSGRTASSAYGRLRVVAGALVWDDGG
jgi:ABC-type branched-subunit amino acid transport system substrate-binding protein